MSGGFFRGTSADQDTRFSNKKTKLLRSQKFPPELEHLVDMTRVKMDVMKPWIATRVTELLGFEDEVLINFIYGLLEGKEVNGKEVQISLTGFMEKNTGKFMKELWILLLSAQNNASGVPQQFLDAKEEETKKKKAEIERTADEIRKKRDKEIMELEQEKLKKMDVGDDNKVANGDRELNSERFVSKFSNDNLHDNGKREGLRGRHRVSRSPLPADSSPSSLRGSRSRSISRSRSNSRSYSSGQRRSRSISKSPGRQRRSLTTRRRYSRESRSPLRWRSSYYRRRSRSRSYRRSISPRRRRNYSPIQRCSRSPMRRRSPPLRRRRSPSPVRHRSPPLRRRSPPPHRRSSPPIRRRSPSPKSQSSRSPSPTQHKLVSPIGRRSPSNFGRRSPSPLRRRSPSPTRHRPHSPVKRRPRSPVHQRPRSPVRLRSPSPVRRQQRRSRSIPRQESPLATRRSPLSGHKRSISPLTKASDGSSSTSSIRRSSLSPARSSPVIRRTPSQSRDRMRRSSSPDDSPVRQVKDQVMHDSVGSPRRKRKQHHDSSETSKDRLGERRSLKSTPVSDINDSRKVHKKDLSHSERVGSLTRIRGHADASEPRNKDQERLRERSSGKRGHSEISEQQISPPLSKSSLQEKERQKSPPPMDIKQAAKSDADGELKKLDLVSKSVGNVDNEQGGISDSVSEGSDKHTHKGKEKKRRKRSGRHEIDSESESSGSEAEDRKEVKRRKKEERKLRKEERRRRREERRRRKDERRAEKLLKTRRMDSSDSSPADNEKHHGDAGGEEAAEKDEKKLEIELRMKAIESFKAKKSVSH